MQMNITPQSTLAEIQASFQSAYPKLKLQFILDGKAPVSVNFIKDETLSIKDYYPQISSFQVDADENVATANFEKAMMLAGLTVQVFRRSGRIWLETIQTDHLSLREQQMLSELHDEETEETRPNEIDYD